MPDLSYAYASTRVKAMETKLLSRKQMADLYGVTSLAEMTVLLQETAYKEALVKASQKHEGVELLLVGLQDEWIRTLRRMDRLIPEKAQPAWAVLLLEFDVQDIKTIAAKKALGQSVGPDELISATDSSRKLNQKLLEQTQWADVVSVLRTSGFAETLRADEKQIVDHRDFRLLCQVLDRSYAKRVSEFIKAKAHRNTRALLELRSEFLQSMIVLRLKPFATRPDIERELFGTPSRRVQGLLEAGSLDEAISQLGLPADVVEAYRQKKMLSIVELALEKNFVESVLKKFRASVLNFGAVIGFLYLKSAEIANLKRLALGKYFGVEDQFRPFLLEGPGA